MPDNMTDLCKCGIKLQDHVQGRSFALGMRLCGYYRNSRHGVLVPHPGETTHILDYYQAFKIDASANHETLACKISQ